MKISIIITAYNAQDYILKALNSVVNQTYKDIEIVVVEDCSTDTTKEIIKDFAQKHPIKLIEHETNLGAGLSRRDGINASSGDYIMTLDSDDWLDNTYIEQLVDEANSSGAEIVGGGIIVEEKNDYRSFNYYGRHLLEGIEKIKMHFNEKIIFMNNKIVARRLCDLVPYNHRRYIEDTQTIVPMMYYANKVSYIDVCGYHYWMNPNSLTHKTDEVKENIYRFLCAMDLIEFFEDKEPEYRAMFNKTLALPYLVNLKKYTFADLNRFADANIELGYKLIKLIDVQK